MKAKHQNERGWALDLRFEGDHVLFFFRRIGRFVRRAAPVLRRVARVAAPIVGSTVGGSLGGKLGRVATPALGAKVGRRDQRTTGPETEDSSEKLTLTPLPARDAIAEFMAAVASEAQTLAEAEAMVGAATAVLLSGTSERMKHKHIIPDLVRGSAVLTRILRRRRITRPAVRVVPTIVRRTARRLTEGIAAGKVATKRAAGRAMALETLHVMGNSEALRRALEVNANGVHTVRTWQPTSKRSL